MNKFQKEIERLIQRQEHLLQKELKKAYDQSLKELKFIVNDYMTRYADLSFSEKIQAQRYYSLMLQIESQMDILSGRQQDHIFHFLESVGELGFNELFYDFEMTQGTSFNFTMIPKSALETIIQTPVGNFKLSERLQDGVVGDLKGSLNEVLLRGFRNGWSTQKMAQQLVEKGNASLKRSMTIARTESGRVSSITRQRSQEYADSLGLELEKTWVSTLDGKTRDSHARLDGQTVGIKEYFSIGGRKALQPHMFGIPSEDINCRCRTITRIKDHELKERRDNESKRVVKYKNYDEWERVKKEAEKQSASDKFHYIDEKQFKKWMNRPANVLKKHLNQVYGGHHGYIGTMNGFNINKALRKDLSNQLSEKSRETIKILDKLTNNHAIDKDILAYRYVNEDLISEIIDQNREKLKNLSDKEIFEQFNLGKLHFTDKGFTSLSLIPDKNLFKSRPVKFEIELLSGTKSYVTQNVLESEMILPRGSKYEIISLRQEDARLVVLMRLIE